MNKILYIQIGVGFLHPNKRVIAELRKHFPDHEIELYDLMPLLKRDRYALFRNGLAVLQEYAYDFVTRRKSLGTFRYHFLGTTWIFQYFSKLIRKKIQSEKYACVIQTQCLCDSSGNGIPNFIYTDHTNLFNLHYKWNPPAKHLRTRAYIDLETQAFRNATGVFVMSENIRTSLLEQYGVAPEKITMAYVGSNTPVPEEHNPNKYYNKNIIFVGKDWQRKGGPLLVRAFEKVLEQIPDATLTIVGCTPQIGNPNCRVLGEVTLDEVAHQYREASLFCFPTTREPFGIVFIEAMLNKLAIVTNNMGAAPSLVTPQNGCLLENDTDEYARVLVQLLNNPELCRRMGEESYRIARQFYSWENTGTIMAQTIAEHIRVPMNQNQSTQPTIRKADTVTIK